MKEVHQRVSHPHVLRRGLLPCGLFLCGLFLCGLCGRRMQAQRSHEQTYYGCRYPREYALANHVKHPFNIYVRERDVLPALDVWLTTIFAPHRFDHTIRSLAEAQAELPAPAGADASDLAIVLAECDAKLARYKAALDAGADPVAVASWTRTVQAERAAAAAAAAAMRETRSRLTESEIRNVIEALDDLATVIKDADPADKARIYAGLKSPAHVPTVKADRASRSEPRLARWWGNGVCPRGVMNQFPMLSRDDVLLLRA